MRLQLRLRAASTVLAACSLVITGCGPKDTDAEGPASGPGSRAEAENSGSTGGSSPEGEGKGSAGGESGPAGDQADGGEGRHEPDAPACTGKNSSVVIRTVRGSGEAEIQLVNNGSKACTVFGAPNVVLKSSDDEILNPEPATDEKQGAPLVTLEPGGGVAGADLTYESGPVSEGGSQDGITCGGEAASAEVSNEKATWQAEIRSSEPKNADSVPGGLIVCGPTTTVAPFQE